MRTIILIISIVGLIFCLCFAGIWAGWWYPKTYEYALQLANDSSLPQTKADYLKEYLAKIKTVTGRPRFTFMRPDLELSKQVNVLEGLIQRFEDIAKLNLGEMAYQQGMFQLTGQEIEHQLGRISGIFQSAKLRENILVFLIIYWGWIIFGLMLLIGVPWDEL